MIIRPENVKISKTVKKGNCLKAKIYEQVYDGAFTKILMHVDGNIVKSIISGNDKLYNRGDEVYIYWDIEDAIVLGDKNGK